MDQDVDAAAAARGITADPAEGLAGRTRPQHPGVFAWSLPSHHYYGNIAGPAQSHGGFDAWEQEAVINIQRWLVYRGCVRNVPAGQWATTTWADGKWENATDVACATWHDRFYPNQPYPKRIYRDDHDRLVAPPH